jgi:ubiquinone/menaquinone biosynthesis C-methylase UbiE
VEPSACTPFIEFAGIAGAMNVLDVGCGTGGLGFCLAQDPEISVRGIDLSKPYVEHARSRNKDARLAFQIGDACRLPYPDAAFDLTASMLALQFIPQCQLTVREMRRVTRPGGTVTAATWDTRGGYVAYRMFFDTAAICDPNGN